MKRILGLLLGILALPVLAQMSGQIGQFDLVPQRIYANPAFQPKAKINVAFPALGNVYIHHGNNWIQPRSFVEGGSSALSSESILSVIGENATTTQEINLELMHVGFRFGKNYLHIRAAERFRSHVNIPADVFRLALYGNVGEYQFENNTANFSDLGVDLMHFREYAIGFNRRFSEKMVAGLTVKYLYGMESIQTVNSSLQLRTDPNTYELSSSGQLDVHTSGINSLISSDEEFDIREYLIGRDNTGFSFDFGATYEPIENLQLQVSAHDIGFIQWKDDLVNYQTDDASFAFNGIDMTDFLFQEDIDFGDEFQSEADSLLQELEDTYGFAETNESFKTSLNGFMRYGVAYSILTKSDFRGTAWANATHGVGESQVRFQASIGYNQTIWNSIQLGVHATKTEALPLTFGGGVSINSGFFQIYAMAENFAVFSPISEVEVLNENNASSNSTVFLPSNPMDLRIHIGVNFTFVRNFQAAPDKERAMIK
ncbi:MAG: DUF5723 family protein [Flavobacteriales bacterium]|nr:DUF5723 family protein [Flavobacteriales bacterium]